MFPFIDNDEPRAGPVEDFRLVLLEVEIPSLVKSTRTSTVGLRLWNYGS